MSISPLVFPQQSGRAGDFIEIGRSGLKHFGGLVQQEFLTTLRGRSGIAVFREMRDNDPVIGASFTILEQTIRKASWFIELRENTQEQARAGQFLKECIDDMSHTWDEMITETLSMFCFGWAWMEIVYKMRKGDVKDPKRRSKFDDGKIGWRKIALRMQTSFYRWDIDRDGGIQGMIQNPAPEFKFHNIPISKSLLFRTKKDGNNPEGRSLLRNAYRPWFIKKNIEEIEAIGIERDLIGMPVIKPPEGFNIDSKENAGVAAKVQSLLYALRRDEQDGIFLPPGWEIEVLGAGRATRRQFDIDKVIGRYDKRIAMSTLTQAIMLGADRVGSFALSRTQVDDFFLVAAQGYLLSIVETINRFAVPELFKRNSEFAPLVAEGKHPTFVPGKISGPSLSEVGEYIKNVSDAGFDLGGTDIVDELRRIGEFKETENRRTRIAIREPENGRNGNKSGARAGKLDEKPTNPNFLPKPETTPAKPKTKAAKKEETN